VEEGARVSLLVDGVGGAGGGAAVARAVLAAAAAAAVRPHVRRLRAAAAREAAEGEAPAAAGGVRCVVFVRTGEAAGLAGETEEQDRPAAQVWSFAGPAASGADWVAVWTRCLADNGLVGRAAAEAAAALAGPGDAAPAPLWARMAARELSLADSAEWAPQDTAAALPRDVEALWLRVCRPRLARLAAAAAADGDVAGAAGGAGGAGGFGEALLAAVLQPLLAFPAGAAPCVLAARAEAAGDALLAPPLPLVSAGDGRFVFPPAPGAPAAPAALPGAGAINGEPVWLSDYTPGARALRAAPRGAGGRAGWARGLRLELQPCWLSQRRRNALRLAAERLAKELEALGLLAAAPGGPDAPSDAPWVAAFPDVLRLA
jgi:hypothetical protein